jgi:molybdate transport system ATP-binding protein
MSATSGGDGGLRLDGVRVRRGGFALTLDLAVALGEVVAVVGPNGAGKTTLLRAVAGLAPLDAGRVVLAGRVLEDVAAGVRLPPQARHAGVVFQDLRLLPHLRARDDVAFGPRARGVARAEAAARAEEWLARVGLAGREDARPAELSGGQAQRVALARALAAAPDLLLLDEPLASADVAARDELRAVLRTHLGAFARPVLLITHEPAEAVALGDRVVVLEDGAVVQDGTPAEVAAAPASAWVARMLGG